MGRDATVGLRSPVKGIVSSDCSDNATGVLALSNANREALPHQFAQLAHGAHQQPFVGIEIEMLPTSVCFKSPASVDEESLATERRAAVFVFPADWREGAALGRL